MNKEFSHITPKDFTVLPKIPNAISFLHINCRNLPNKIHYINILNNSRKAKIIEVTETWLNDSNCDSICIPGYSFIATSRSEKRGGGVGLSIHQDIVFKFAASTFEKMFVSLKLRNTTITLGVVYRPPNSNLQVFNDEVKVSLDHIRKNGDYVLLGDFNLDVSSDSTSVIPS